MQLQILVLSTMEDVAIFVNQIHPVTDVHVQVVFLWDKITRHVKVQLDVRLFLIR